METIRILIVGTGKPFPTKAQHAVRQSKRVAQNPRVEKKIKVATHWTINLFFPKIRPSS